MPHDFSALVAQFRETLTQQRYNPVVVHNYWRRLQGLVRPFVFGMDHSKLGILARNKAQ